MSQDDLSRAPRTQQPSPQQLGWRRETRRYRRTLGGWWRAALILVPALLAALGMLFSGSSGTPAAAPSPAPTPSTSPSSVSVPNAMVAASPFAITVTPKQLVVEGSAPTQARLEDFLAVARINAGGRDVTNKLTVRDGSTAPFASIMVPTMTAAKSAAKEFKVTYDGAALALSGQADSEDAKSSIGDAFTSTYPNVQVTNNLSIGGSSPSASPSASATADPALKSLTCDNIGATLKTVMARAPIRFVTAGSDVTASSAAAIKTIASAAAKCDGITLTVVGYTDTVGVADRNLALSQRRANQVRDALVAAGMPGDRVKASGAGQTNPVASNDTEAGRAANRRVEITVGE